MRFAVLLAVVAALWVQPAKAAVIVLNYDLIASNFTRDALKPPTHLNVSLTFDNSADVLPTDVGVTVNSFDLAYPVLFNYVKAQDAISLGNSLYSAGCVLVANSFCGFVTGVSGPNPSFYLWEEYGSSGPAYAATNRQLNGATNVPLPEPATWAMMLLGFAAIGFAMRRHVGTIILTSPSPCSAR